MARSRNIKPSFFTNEILGTLDPIISMTFVGLWCLADRTGRMEDRPLRIKAELFPYREGMDVNGYLTVLERNGFIDRYEVNGQKYIQVLKFEKHQSPHHTEKPKGYPANPASIGDSSYTTVKEQLEDVKGKVLERSDSLIPDSLIPDAAKAAGAKAPQSKRGGRLPDDWILPKNWGDWALKEFPSWTVEIIRLEAEKFADHWKSKSGKDAVKMDWEATWRNWCRSDIAQRAYASTLNQNNPQWKHIQAVTTPSRQGQDPALAKIIADGLNASKPSDSVREKMRELARK
jgi:hypothetical protein